MIPMSPVICKPVRVAGLQNPETEGVQKIDRFPIQIMTFLKQYGQMPECSSYFLFLFQSNPNLHT